MRGAVQFLTVLPVGGGAAAAVFFPFVGVLLGASAGGVVLLGGGGSLAALLALAYLMMVTGCLHEDGLADVADAVRAGRSREKIMLILKDSRIGTYGGLALIMSVLIRWQALALCRVNPVYGLVAALALSRASLVVLAGIAPSVGGGLGQAFATGISRLVVVGVVAQAVAVAFVAGWRNAVVMVGCSAVVILVARGWFVRRLGGVNGDCLGATCQAVETVNLVILTWQPSF